MSSNPLVPLILDGGLAAIQLASRDGVQLRITHVALGDAGYTPDVGQTALKHEIARYPIADGQSVGPRQQHLTALADDDKEFWIREVAFILEGGQPLAIWSDPQQVLAYKQAGMQLLLAYDLALSGVPADCVTVQSTGAGLNLALAGELAALATAQIDEAGRGVARDDQLQAQDRQQQVFNRQLDLLQQQLSRMEAQQQAARLEWQEWMAAVAAAQIDESWRGVARDDWLRSQEQTQAILQRKLALLAG
ncbi:phage tail protein [Chromobacterium amazonense]|uniref:Phage tail protein n=1 Tax=Chromobacterium amazonense TaxID=1382803 RepID=A0ABU8V499_9NEIS|nr:phage tail protein [Chromobacterium amazonense]MDQ4540537.1 phage tail protein [Chromobacterium amazonense]